jgi:hypothetical protein
MMTQPQQSKVITPSQAAQAMAVQPQQSPAITQPQAAQAVPVQPQGIIQTPSTSFSALSRSGIFARGVEEKEDETSGHHQDKDAQTDKVETSDMAVLEEGTPEIAEAVALRIETPFHTTASKGSPVELKPGVYEIGTVMDLLLGLAQEGHQTVLLDANRNRHSFPIHQSFAAIIPGSSDDLHLLYMTGDGRRFEVVGYPAAVPTRSTAVALPLSDTIISKVVAAASVKSRSVASPPCKPNLAETGPRWVPVPCSLPTIPAPTVSP